jgi:hypothetical protein
VRPTGGSPPAPGIADVPAALPLPGFCLISGKAPGRASAAVVGLARVAALLLPLLLLLVVALAGLVALPSSSSMVM